MKKIVSIILSFILLLSCSKKETNKNSITVMIPDWAVPSEDMLKAFEEESGVKVNMNILSWDNIKDKIAIAAAGGIAAADVVEVDWSWVGEFYSADLLVPIEISEEDKNSMPSIIPFTVDGKVLALPYANDFRIAYYNTNHFNKAGITKAPQTWNEVYDSIKKIKESGITKYPFSMPLSASENTTTSLIWLAYSKYGKVFNNDGSLNKEAVLGSLEFINQLLNVDKLIDPANITANGLDPYRKINNGEASFIVGPTSFVSRIQDPNECTVVGEVIPTLLPGSTSTSDRTFALPEGLGVLKLSKNIEGAMKFVKWYNSATIQKELNYIQNTMPTRLNVMQELIYEGKLKNSEPLIEESKLIKSPFINGVPTYYAKMSTIIFNAVNQMAMGLITPEEAFNNMDTKIKELL